ncbi:MAG: aspartate carbamoyltransferase [Bacteroidales bacterium]|jgi:aspartate carbamoyltransferase catalytic subunit|uniref:aspartate carbamoyltransferase n=1 Tax=bioreactor metagenome TaxID=1076179 RepID=A0A644UEP2_9ZZZZ|nr:aspartate carbamoyltransferase [Bacteroidales bacterium]NCC18641.1 aspartate carbamoyltransferase [Bacteroidia bacterium]MDD4068084.1 aspartate carbamoyltransferase [Bacteroidales bacterium]MDD4739138.1 aspartate carbamoyltransferase [Bacteroidales bacterium]MDY4790456.1 aspartate carbamoyltransferase [Bacteroidales bacterium]
MNLKGKNLISISDYSKEEYLEILRLAEEFEKNPKQEILRDKVVASIFFEPSTRTRLSFESAASMLGAKVIGFSNPSATSQSKGESLHDTIKMLSSYVDIIVMRHSIEGAARYAAEVASVPFINAGDGANQHPTQCMLDLYSILKTQGKLENLNITLVGDLKYGRTVHSLVQAMCNFNATFHLVSPNELKLPSSVKMHIKDANLKYEQYTKLEDVIPFSDIIYMTRIQRERFSDPLEYEKVKDSYILDAAMLKGCKETMRILHPLPRVNEIATDVDKTPYAYYFQQARNGVYVRQALMAAILGVK